MKAIITKYHGPTNSRGSRIIASDDDGNRITVSYRPELNSDDNHDAAALALCARKGWRGTLRRGSLRHGNVYVWSNSSNPLEVGK